jgi:plasmid stability protein
MPTLYVENVPADLYEALRKRARSKRRSIAAEVVSLLQENIPTEKELESRRALFRKLERLRSKPPRSNRRFPTTEEMVREDRGR